MPYTESFLATCRTQIEATAEFTAYRTAYGLYDAASVADKAAYWQATFSDSQSGQSPAMALKKVIRSVVTSQAAITGGISDTERETAYRSLQSQYVGKPAPPISDAKRTEILTELLTYAG